MGPKESAARVEGRSRLQNDYTPSPLDIAPDGTPVLPRAVHLPVVQDASACDKGPCRHRHVYTGNFEAMAPRDGTQLTRVKLDASGQPVIARRDVDGSAIYETEPWTPREVTRSCYPSPGVVIELSADAPVLECDRWDPEDPDEYSVVARAARREAYYERAEAAARARVEVAGEIDTDHS